VLHEAFDYPYRQIAEVLETSEANARQLGSRARIHLDRERGATVSAAERERLLGAFLAAAQDGDVERLESLLAEDAVTISDGGGLVSAARKPVLGRQRVAAFVSGLVHKFGVGAVIEPAIANGQPGFIAWRDGAPDAFLTVDIAPEGVRRVLLVRNPEKLERLAVTLRAATRS
jgi:RNA polymerase sigma-70 factor (ECF subfamily)